MGFAYCDFVRRDRPMVASVEPRPLRPDTRAEADSNGSQPETTAAIPAPAPVEVKELPKPDEKPAAVSSDEKPELRSTKE